MPQHPPWSNVSGPYALEARHKPATSISAPHLIRSHLIVCWLLREPCMMQIHTHTRCNPRAHVSPKRAG